MCFVAIRQHLSDWDGSAIFGISSNKSQSGPILFKIRCNLTCFGPVQSFDVLGWGSTLYSPWGARKNYSQIALSNHSRLTHMSAASQSHAHVILALILFISIASASRSDLALITFSSHSHLAASHSPLTFDM
jgi:hypothetical protein